jgi:hypothetical protein
MKNTRHLLLCLIAAAGCAHAHADNPSLAELRKSGYSASSVNVGDAESVATIRGRVGIAVLNDAKVELRDRTVYVNGVSYGSVPDVCEVRYVVTKQGSTLFVDGQPRPAPAGKAAS